MSIVARITLPGFDAGTETNPDNFSLIADEDNVLIKEFIATDTGDTSSESGYTRVTIPHNLGYIPFVMPFFETTSFDDGDWLTVNNSFDIVDAPTILGAVDTQNYYYLFADGVYSDPEFLCRIFYDDMDSGNPSFSEDDIVFKFSRPGKSADSNNPNDYIMHSSLNNLKILHHDVKEVSLTSGFGFNNAIPHNANVDSPYQCIVFCEFPDGKTTMLGGVGVSVRGTLSFDENHSIGGFTVDDENIHLFSVSSNITVKLSYYFFGAGKDNTVGNNGIVLAITDGRDISTAHNPDHYYFHSDYPTLKYFQSGTHDMGDIDTTTVEEIEHGLGYTPFFAGYVNELIDFIGNGETVYASTPYYLGQSTFISNNRDVSGNVYADDQKIYLKGWLDTNATAVEPNYPFEFFYKIFNNNLGL